MRERTIYVQLLDEGVEVWRPAQAEHLGDDRYRVIGPKEDEDEVWEFQPGDVVRCRMTRLYEGSFLVAFERVER